MKAKSPRRGYAMVLVLVFVALVLTFYGVCHRHIGATLRIEGTRTFRKRLDEGSLRALARGLALLETGDPPAPAPENPYVCQTTIQTSTGQHDFTVTFTRVVAGKWSVSAEPGAYHVPMPARFTD